MSILTENIVLSRTRAQDLNSVRKLNCWGTELTDVSLVRRMPFVEVLSLSVNSISTLLDFSFCENLQELYIRKNCISDLNEVVYLQDLPKLKSLWLADNPCAESQNYRMTILRTLPNLQKLDNIAVQPQEIEIARSKGSVLIRPSEDSENETAETVVFPIKKTPVQHLEKKSISQQEFVPNSHDLELVAAHKKQESSENLASKPIKPSLPTTVKPEVIPRELVIPANNFEQQPQVNQGSRASIVQTPTIQPSSQSSLPNGNQFKPTSIALPEEQPNASTNSTTPNSSAPHHNYAFYARVQTLVDHSSRRPKKPSDLKCEARSLNQKTSRSCSPVQQNSSQNNNNQEEESFPTGEIDSQYYNGPGRDFSELETRSCSMDSESSYYAEQRGALGSSRQEKNSPTRLLPKGGKNRNSNILSAVLCLIKELDYASLEVVDTAIHCQLEDMENH